MECHVAVVPRDLASLVPEFLKNRKADLAALGEALHAQHAEKLKALGERIYSTGNPYGFRYLTSLGRRIIEAAQARKFDEVDELVRTYADYLERVRIEYD